MSSKIIQCLIKVDLRGKIIQSFFFFIITFDQAFVDLEPAVGADLLVLHAGPRLVLVQVDDQADAAAESGGGVHFQAALDREGAIQRSKVRDQKARCKVQVGEMYCRHGNEN